jgi:myosin heavy subunit
VEVAESVTAWLPPDMSDGVLGGTDRLVETPTTATFSELLAANPVSAHATQDMSNLLYMEAQHVLHNLKQRFEWQLIHTFVGGMLVVCNPYVFLPHLYPSLHPANSLYRLTRSCRYSSALMLQYDSATLKQLEARQLAPHIYCTTAQARKAIIATQVSILTSKLARVL